MFKRRVFARPCCSRKFKRTRTTASTYRRPGPGKKNMLANTGGFFSTGRFPALQKNVLTYHGTWGRFLPDTFYTNLYNAESWVDTYATGEFDHVVKANSIHDPWNALSNNAVLGHSLMEQIYYWYQVISCTMECEMVNVADDPVRVHLFPADVSTSFSSKGEDLDAMPSSAHTLVPSSHGTGRIRLRINIADRIRGNANDRALMNADPTQLTYLHMCLNNYSGGAFNLSITTRISFRVKLMGLRRYTLAQAT